MRSTIIAATLVLGTLSSSAAFGQLSVPQYVIAGGGGTSSGGGYSVSGTIGQPVVGISVNGSTSVNSGFWGSVSIACGLADVASLGGQIGADGALTVDDIVVYLAQFFANNLSVADIAGLGGSATPDGQITADDLVLFLAQFFQGC
ncbi:MAG: GC-type dockerin domain-anchored protein [Phycisphaerales bacterium]